MLIIGARGLEAKRELKIKDFLALSRPLSLSLFLFRCLLNLVRVPSLK